MAVEESTFRGIIHFFADLGIYDVILPFLLVFTIVFAVLEKTKIFGTEKIGDREYPKKNLNSIIGFVAAFLVVASTRLVAAINESIANVVLLLLVSISFLLLIGSFYKEGEPVALEGKWRNLFMIIMFLGVVLIFLQAIKIDQRGVIEYVYDFMRANWHTNFGASAIFIVLVVIFMVWVTGSPKESRPSMHGHSHDDKPPL
jgi:hypothetical protein